MLDRAESIGFSIAAIIGACCLVIAAAWPFSTPVQSAPGEIGPNTIVRTVRHNYQRPPASVPPGMSPPPERSISELSAHYDADGCVERLVSVTTTMDGEFLERTELTGDSIVSQRGADPRTRELDTRISEQCAHNEEERRQAAFAAARRSPDVEVMPRSGGRIEAIEIVDPDELSSLLTEGLDVESVSFHTWLDAGTLRPGDRVMVATTTSGEEVILNQSIVVSQEVRPAD